jgi:hypothetical protein
MALDRLWQGDVTSPVSNSNAMGARIDEGCAPSGINNSIRNLWAMVLRETAYDAGNISASVSTNLCTSSTGLYLTVIHAAAGNPNIASFGVVPGEHPEAAVRRIVEFSCSASLSHGPALRLIGGVSRRTQPGDIGEYLHVGTADSWIETFYSPASGSPLGGSISLSTVNAITSNFVSVSASVINVGGVQEFPRFSFMAVNDGSQVSITTTARQITFTTETFDVGGFFASSAWTPAAGKYRLHTHVTMDSLAESDIASCAILQDGVSMAVSNAKSPASSSQMTMSIDMLIDANGSNAYTVSAWKSAAGLGVIVGGTTPRRTWFCGERI